MSRRPFGLVAALLLAGVCAGQPPKPPAPAEAPRVFTGKVVPVAAPKGKSDAKAEERGVTLVADDGTSYPLIEDDVSRMFFVDKNLQNRPVRITGFQVPGTKDLRVVRGQLVKDGKIYDFDYWCDQCQISLLLPGPCYCCGDEAIFRERLAK